MVASTTRTGPAERARRPTRRCARAAGSCIRGASRARWLGYPDFLIRVDEPSDLGEWSYEVYDAKLGAHPQPRHIFQLLFYTDELERIQGRRPERMHLMLGDGRAPPFAPDDFAAYAARVTEQFEARYAELAAGADARLSVQGRASASSATGGRSATTAAATTTTSRSSPTCSGAGPEARGRRASHTSASSPTSGGDERAAADAARRSTLRAQADCRSAAARSSARCFELLEPEADRGLARLPGPSAGDVFFDFEGDPYWGEDGLEYLFGTGYEEDGEWRYWPLWATTRAEEKARSSSGWPGSPLGWPSTPTCTSSTSTPTSRRRSSGSVAPRVGEHELDELLRRKVLVDLYGISRQAIRAGVESYGLKALEPVIGFERDAELRGAIGSLRRWQAWQDDGDQEHLDGIAGYNEDDCAATRALYAGCSTGGPRPRRSTASSSTGSSPSHPSRPGAKLAAYLARLERRARAADRRLPDDESEDDEQRACARRSTCSATTAARPSPPTGRSSRGAGRRSRSCATRTRRRSRTSRCRASRRGHTHHVADAVPRAGVQARPGDLDDPMAERGGEAPRAR